MNNIQNLKDKWVTPLLSINVIKQFQEDNPYNQCSLLIKSFLYDAERDYVVDEFVHLSNWILISEIIQSKLN